MYVLRVRAACTCGVYVRRVRARPATTKFRTPVTRRAAFWTARERHRLYRTDVPNNFSELAGLELQRGIKRVSLWRFWCFECTQHRQRLKANL